jgi:hypothetical protein
MDDLTELLKRIYEFSFVYQKARLKPPLFRLTPNEHGLFRQHIINSNIYMPQYYGDLPPYMGIDFELVGSPILFCGNHIRSDSGIKVKILKSKDAI